MAALEYVPDISQKRRDHLAAVDEMPVGLRRCVHEFGLPIVMALVDNGVTDPRRIRQIVRECWNGARQYGQSGGARSTVDFLLAQGPVSYATLQRALISNSMLIVPMCPTRRMVEASLATVSGGNVRCTKEEKHRRRLTAALKAEAESVA